MLRRFSFPIWEEIGVERPTVEQVRRYLRNHGWQEQPYGPQGFTYGGPRDDDDREIVLLLPSSEQMDEYPQRLLELLRALSLIERRLIRHLLTDMHAPESNGVPVPTATTNDTTNDADSKKARRPKKGRQA